jgi:hypothetical protein
MQGSGSLVTVMVVVMLALGWTSRAAAQRSVSEPAIAPAFEQRLTDELAARGIVLAHRNLGLLIEPQANHWNVSLVDLATGRAVVAARIERLPDDPGEAVAVLLRAVVALEDEITASGARREPRPAATAVPEPRSADALALRAHRQTSELAYRRYALRFGATYDPTVRAMEDTGRRWTVYQGGIDQELDPEAFYHLLGRDDLGDAYRRRQTLMIGGFAAGGLAFAVAA